MSIRLTGSAEVEEAARAERPLPYSHLVAGSPPQDVVLDAAAACVDRNGFEATSLEEVAAQAGVSRTTLYRRYGNREALFTALLVHRSQPFVSWARRVSAGPGSTVERLETMLTGAILEMQQVGWLTLALRTGMSPVIVRLFKASQRTTGPECMEPLLATVLNERPPTAGVTLETLSDWMVDQMIAFASAPDWDEEQLRARLRYFVMPVLTPPMPRVEDRLAAIEARVIEIAEKLERPRR